MKISSPKRTFQDSEGQWWFLFGPKRVRVRVHPLVCPWCKKSFIPPYRGKAKEGQCCSRECGMRKFNAENPTRWQGDNSARWKGGTVVRRGYRLVWMPLHHSIGRHTKRKYVLEHRLVMEKMIGRDLMKHENVHHKNGDRLDNRPENLELWSQVQPPGQRLRDRKHCPTCTCGDAVK